MAIGVVRAILDHPLFGPELSLTKPLGLLTLTMLFVFNPPPAPPAFGKGKILPEEHVSCVVDPCHALTHNLTRVLGFSRDSSSNGSCHF